ncbi:MAG: NTP transferase domain-containing protein [Promethearchaeota archaeon]
MQIPAIIMAGGKGERFNFDKVKSKYQEKLLLQFNNRFMIEYAIEATLNAKNINKVIIALSPFTPQTKSVLEKKKMSIILIETPGINYHSDLLFVIKKLNLEVVITIAADIPLIKPKILDEIINKYFILSRPALSVMAEIKLFSQYGLKPTIIFQSDDKQNNLVPLGINIIDGRLIGQPELDQAIFISEQEELLFNINTIDDFYQLKKFNNRIK